MTVTFIRKYTDADSAQWIILIMRIYLLTVLVLK